MRRKEKLKEEFCVAFLIQSLKFVMIHIRIYVK